MDESWPGELWHLTMTCPECDAPLEPTDEARPYMAGRRMRAPLVCGSCETIYLLNMVLLTPEATVS